MRQSFILHKDSLCVLEDLTNEQRGELFYAIYCYQIEEEIELSPIVKIAFSQFKNQFARDNEKYEKTVERRREAGSKGGKQRVANQANASTTKQNQANQAVSKSKNKSVSKSDSDSKKESKSNSLVTTESYDDSLRIANYLLNNILKANPSFKVPSLEAWARDIDKAIRIDKRSTQQLKDCIDWIYSPNGEFWQKNILSGKKLREKFDTMNMQVITKQPTKQERQLSESAKAIVKAMKARGHSDEEIENELRKIA